MNARRGDWSTGLRRSLPYVLRFSAMWIVVSVAAVITVGALGVAVIIEGPPPGQHARLMVLLGLQTSALIVALLVLAVLTAHRLAEPLLAVRRALQEVRDGDLSRRLSFRSGDSHLRELEAVFNEMMASIRSMVARAGSGQGDGGG